MNLDFLGTTCTFSVIIEAHDWNSMTGVCAYAWQTQLLCFIINIGLCDSQKIILCISLHLDSVAYEIRWYQSHIWASDSFVLLASIDRWGVVRKSPRNDTSDCSLERLSTKTFVLTIHGTQDSDAGEYYCTATPWIRSTTTEDWRKEAEIISERVFLHVKFACEFYFIALICVVSSRYYLWTVKQIFCFDSVYLHMPYLFGTRVNHEMFILQ